MDSGNAFLFCRRIGVVLLMELEEDGACFRKYRRTMQLGRKTVRVNRSYGVFDHVDRN